jgi:hypothetical protein
MAELANSGQPTSEKPSKPTPQLRLFRVDRRRNETPWVFSFDEHGATLISHENKPVATFLHEMAESRIILPSFWENIEHLGVVDGLSGSPCRKRACQRLRRT